MRKGLKFLLAGVGLMVSAPVLAEWRLAESEHFEMYSEESEKDIVDFVTKLERFNMIVAYFSGLKEQLPGKKLKAFWVRDAQQLQDIIKGGYGYIYGYYVTATPYGAIIVVPDDTRSRNAGARGGQIEGIAAEKVLLHEYGHHFMLQNFPVAQPAWFVEGFAEYYGNTEFDSNGDIRVGVIAEARKPELNIVGLQKLETLFDSNAPQSASFYGTSWLLVHYLNFDPERRKQLTAYLADVLAGTESVKAAEKNFTGGIAGLRKALDKYWSSRKLGYQTLGNIKQADRSKIKVSMVPQDQASAMISNIRYLSGFSTDETERRKLKEKLQSSVKTDPNSAFLKAFLADIYVDNDEDDAAIAIAAEALTLDPINQRARLVKAKALMEKAQTLEGANTKNPSEAEQKAKEKAREKAESEGKTEDKDVALDDAIVVTAARNKNSIPLWKEALSLILAANKADVDDPLPLYLYYEYLKRRGDRITETPVDGLSKAHVQLPQYTPIRFRLAEAFSEEGDNLSAASIVKAEAFSPHGGPDRRKARALLKRYECLQADRTAKCSFNIQSAAAETKEQKENKKKKNDGKPASDKPKRAPNVSAPAVP